MMGSCGRSSGRGRGSNPSRSRTRREQEARLRLAVVIEQRTQVVVVGSMWNSRRILERVAAAMTGGWDIYLNFRVGPVYIVRG